MLTPEPEITIKHAIHIYKCGNLINFCSHLFCMHFNFKAQYERNLMCSTQPFDIKLNSETKNLKTTFARLVEGTGGKAEESQSIVY